jgi:hypothetical protein
VCLTDTASPGSHRTPVKQARQKLGGMSPSTFYGLVKEGELSLVKIALRSAAVHSSKRKNSMISSGESGVTLPVKRKLPGTRRDPRAVESRFER